MKSKPFWQSKTLWANGTTAVVALLNGAFGWVSITGEETAAFLVVINLVLRAVTKGSVTLS